jgi:HlyD family secretion protein
MNNPASVIGTIADLSEILVEVDVDENDIVRVALDQVAAVRVDALADTKLTGKVVEIGSSGFEKPSQPDVTFFIVKILLEAPPQTLRPGMSARAEITTERRDNAVVIPIGAVASRPSEADDKVERDVVFVEKDGVVSLREVEVGITDELNAAIETGLEAGERIVTGPYRALKKLEDGEMVRQRERKPKKDDKDKADEDSDDESED